MARVFDWNKAVDIIEREKLRDCDAGLEDDWFWTAGTILRDGEPVKSGNPYLGSKWAVPIIRWTDGDKIISVDCYKKSDEDFEIWPQYALDKLKNNPTPR